MYEYWGSYCCTRCPIVTTLGRSTCTSFKKYLSKKLKTPYTPMGSLSLIISLYRHSLSPGELFLQSLIFLHFSRYSFLLRLELRFVATKNHPFPFFDLSIYRVFSARNLIFTTVPTRFRRTTSRPESQNSGRVRLTSDVNLKLSRYHRRKEPHWCADAACETGLRSDPTRHLIKLLWSRKRYGTPFGGTGAGVPQETPCRPVGNRYGSFIASK